MAGFRNSSDDYGPVAEINITPLVDVMLVLLVIFMVTAPMLESGIPIQLPKASSKALPKGETPVTLNISKEGKIFFQKEEIPFNALSSKLQQFYQGRDKQEIYIRADSALTYGFVAEVMATVKNAGILKIGLVTLPPGK
jgi:biopolymer transport protein TolR